MSTTTKTDMKTEPRAEFAPKVALIGRPNVGKSTLFNILTDSRKAVVKDQPGVTRDIQIEPVEIWGKSFDVIDTGGLTEASDMISQLIKESVSDFLQSVDMMVIVMDGRSGLIPEDRDLIRIAKQLGKPFVIAVNKIDKVQDEEIAKADFYEFGADVIACSFEQRRGLAEILEWITERIPEREIELVEGTTIAIVGKPNAGKSSLTNNLLGQQRMLVSPMAGTTVDAIDTPFLYNNKKYILVDTAGLRRSSKREEDVEIISAFKSQDAIRRANLVLLMIDGLIGPTEQDAKILQAILEVHKGVILVVNKMDLAKEKMDEPRKVILDQIKVNFHFFQDIPVVFTSAKTGHGVRDLLNMIEDISEKLRFRVPTSELNDFFFEAIRRAPAPVYATTNVKFYYLTQTFQKPPAFIAFANHPDGVTPSYRRFLVAQIKERWKLYGVPIRIFCMKSGRNHGE
jgi:GTP-binding protein